MSFRGGRARGGRGCRGGRIGGQGGGRGGGFPGLTDRNGDYFSCEVQSSANVSIIRLTNTNTKDICACYPCVSPCESRSDIVDMLLGRVDENLAEIGQSNIGALTLKHVHSPYFMKLKLTLVIDGKLGKWSFPLTPEDASAIHKRETEKEAEFASNTSQSSDSNSCEESGSILQPTEQT
ncbi:hypothetical protein PPTG_17655 [Phytophthora nicotianae INRA-310]|uniref:Uncharacterized protein n=1 Tax=Phytophthora nicotianae (strain INRA-310) TaxID=761204 RepID=W2PKP5_PHYN3|nr:hypothetical protein PPTG_17655 [Phytophthora nicotianae INRA-310]ETN00794.1 hypothetical protein PPTG_17655 [Phytophthora nicotianae INRA-310]